MELRDAINALRNEAAISGDIEQVAICNMAMDGDEKACAECARVIAAWAAEAEAMNEAVRAKWRERVARAEAWSAARAKKI